MMFPFQCPHCGGTFQIPSDLAGQAVACPHCNSGVLIPEISVPESTTSLSPYDPPKRTPPTRLEPATPTPPMQSTEPPRGVQQDGPQAWSDPPNIAPPPIHSPAQAATGEPPVNFPPAFAAANLSPSLEESLVQPPSKNSQMPAAERMFVIPTLDGGQAVICEPTKVAVSGTRRRELPNLSSEQKATRRMIKNVVVFGMCGALLIAVLWWLLNRGPL